MGETSKNPHLLEAEEELMKQEQQNSVFFFLFPPPQVILMSLILIEKNLQLAKSTSLQPALHSQLSGDTTSVTSNDHFLQLAKFHIYM